MRKYSAFIHNNSLNYAKKYIYSKTSVNIHHTNEDQIKHIIKNRIFKNKNLIIKSIQKRKKLPDNFIPKNEIFYSTYKDKAASNKNKNESNKNENETKNAGNDIPFKTKIFNFQKKLNRANLFINKLSEENKMFHEGYQNSLLTKQKEKNIINPIENITTKDLNYFYKNNIFNQSLLLTKQKRIPHYILESLDNNESKEDLKLIEYLRTNFRKGKSIQSPDFLNKEKEIDKDEKRKILRDIKQMKKEIKVLEENITNYEKNMENINDLEVDKDKKKELDLIRKKLDYLQTNDINKKLQLSSNDVSKAKSTKNVNKKLFLFPDDSIKRGEYKLVTKCVVNNKRNMNQKKVLFKENPDNIRFQDFLPNYNKAKSFLNPIKKDMFSSDIMKYNSNINTLNKKGRRQILKKKFFYNEKYLDSLSLGLESFTEKNPTEKDIVNLYSFMKKGNLMNIKQLLSFYKKKYGKDYVPENVIKNVKKHVEKYNLVHKMNGLDKLDDLDIGKGQKYRDQLLENVKELDEQLQDGGVKFAKRILDFN